MSRMIAGIKSYCADGSHSVAMTIHQPRQEIFAAFDALLLMYRGSTAYFGDPLAKPWVCASVRGGHTRVEGSSDGWA